MSALGNRVTTRVAVLMTLAQVSCDACDPWPAAKPSVLQNIETLVVLPNELDIHVEDPTTAVQVRVIGRVYNGYHIPVIGVPLQFTITPTGKGLSKTDAVDITTLVVEPTVGTPADQDFTLEVKHVASNLTYTVPVHVRYSPPQSNGVAAPANSVSMEPMAGLASGEASGAWKGNDLRAFVRRAQFEKFDPTAVPPVGDKASGTVLSTARTVWRKEDPWQGGDMSVPPTSESLPAILTLTPVFLTDNTLVPPATVAPSAQFLLDLQGGADIIETSLVGATVNIDPVVIPGNRMTWNSDCKVLATSLLALPANLQPDASRLMVYMVDRGTGSNPTPYECDPKFFGGKYNAHAIFLPVGAVEAQSVAHEIGHAFALKHVSWNSGFFQSNLMAQQITGNPTLRDRFSVGQAFHAALDESSYVTMAGKNKSAKLNCFENPRCPPLAYDILGRTPP